MNDNDKAGRYLVKKREPAGFFRWLLANPAVTFHAWIDARRVVLPNQRDLTNDLVAALGIGDVLEAFCLELEAEARADALGRLLRYLAQVWTEPGGRERLAVSCVGGVVLDLTGHSPAGALRLHSAITPRCGLELTILRRPLADENAAVVVAGVAAREISPWVLGWVPLMRGGGDPGIIVPWRAEAERLLTEERDRAELGALTLVFATLARRLSAWQRGLKGWNVQTNPFLDEIRAEARVEGQAKGVRSTVLRLGRQKFGRAPSRRQQKALEAVLDLERLQALAERLLRVDSWAELLDGKD
jgi:hypothetical protein